MHDEKRSVLFMHVIGHNGFLPSAISSVTDFAPDFSVTKLLKNIFCKRNIGDLFLQRRKGSVFVFFARRNDKQISTMTRVDDHKLHRHSAKTDR